MSATEEPCSEFGSGVVVCLAKFSEHMMNRFYSRISEEPTESELRIYGSPEAVMSDRIEMWMNGASVHFCDLDEYKAPPALRALATLTLRIGHGCNTNETFTKETVERIQELWKKACLEVDALLHVDAVWGEW